MKKQAWHYDEVEKELKYLPRKLRINFITIAFGSLHQKGFNKTKEIVLS